MQELCSVSWLLADAPCPLSQKRKKPIFGFVLELSLYLQAHIKREKSKTVAILSPGVDVTPRLNASDTNMVF